MIRAPRSRRPTLRPRERLHLTKRFLAIRRQGAWVRGRLLAVGTLPNELPGNRLGLRIRRGVKGSVERNRAKRVFRAMYRVHKGKAKPGQDLLVVIQQVDSVSLEQFSDEFTTACRRLKILQSEEQPAG